MNRLLYSFCLIIFMASCSGPEVKEKAREAINKTGETVGKGASEFFDGVADGVSERFNCHVQIDSSLVKKGLEMGKIRVTGSDSGSAHILSIYFVFNENMDQPVSIKLLDEEKKEYGRIKGMISGKKGEARFVDFVFDPKTAIETNSLFQIQ